MTQAQSIRLSLPSKGRLAEDCLDFLAEASAVLLNLEADEQGVLVIPRKELGAHQHLHVVAVDPRPCAARYGDRGEYLYSVQDTAAAAENILLAAVDRGLASCWIGAFDEVRVAAALEIPAPITPVAVLPIGHSAESAGKPARRPLGEVTTWL